MAHALSSDFSAKRAAASKDSVAAAFRANQFERVATDGSHLLYSAALPAHDEVAAFVAVSMRRLGDRQGLTEFRDRLTKDAIPHIQVQLQHALMQSEVGDADCAAASLTEILDQYGDNDKLDALRIRAQIEIKAGAIEAFKETLRALRGIPGRRADQVARFLAAFQENKDRVQALRTRPNNEKLEAYWDQRKDFVYVNVIRQILAIVGISARTVVDVGSNSTPMLEFFPKGEGLKRYSVDPGSPYVADNVISVREDFIQWEADEAIDVITCFQVMEHVPDPTTFAKRLLELGEVCIVSVPYHEPAGASPSHIHSMISEETISKWFGKKLNFTYIARELDGVERIIAVFDRHSSETWPTLCRSCEYGLRFKYRWSTNGISEKYRQLFEA